ncbi:MAG: SUMF1/EgtB/PvdO family nonheme iron enzyme [Planctomycetota bacterium]
MRCKPVLQTTMLCCSLTLLMTSGCGEESTPSPIDEPNESDTPSAESAEGQPGAPDTARGAPPPADLPAAFTDYVPTYHDKKVAFDMVYIPGDLAKQIKPFYVAKTEVTWEMFEFWMNGEDLGTASEQAEARSKGLRPSYLGHGHPQTDLGLIDDKQQPAIGMSWRVAQTFCRWLSEQTGKHYRLPTDNEWQYLLEQSGGVPEDSKNLLNHALFVDNADWEELLFTKPRRVAQGKPDRFGLYDLIGNAAEWVQPMGGKRWVRGGHFGMEAKDFTDDWLSVEDHSVWNESYPALPLSESWYIDHYYQGIRLVCSIDLNSNQISTYSKPAEEQEASKPIDVSKLPDAFTDHVLGYQEKQVPFEMVLIPGNEAKGIKPFYIGETEVPRAMFLRWSYGDDLDNSKEFYDLQKKDLRPSVIYGEHIALRVARDRPDWMEIPALGMSWLTAEAYCIWLSEQTGKSYRLPTDREWMHVLKLSGGVPSDRGILLEEALLLDNVERDFLEWEQPRRVDEGKPNKLGLINLLGNATEWVQPTEGQRWVRGGHFGLKAEELTDDWRAVENNEVWNASYPEYPLSKYWYLDFFYTGLRLVCEADSIEPE